MAHLEVEPKPPRPWWPWVLLILVILLVMAWLYKVYNKDSKSHLRANNSTTMPSVKTQETVDEPIQCT